MPRQKTYGKRTKAIYGPRAAFSSPEQAQQPPFAAKPAKLEATARADTNDQDRSKDIEDNDQRTRKSPRKALGEKHANAVVLPLEALTRLKDEPVKKPRAQQKPSEQNARTTRHKIGRDGKVPAQRQHTTFDDDDHPQPIPVSVQDEQIPESPKEKARKIRVRRKRDAQLESADDIVETVSPARERRQHIFFDEEAREVQEVAEAEPTTAEVKAEDEVPAAERGSSATCPYEQHCSGLLELSAHPLTSFDTWSSELSEHFAVSKIAEASFGEVYRLSLLEDITDFCNTDESVFKIIPLQSPESTLPLDKRKRTAAMNRNEEMSNPSDVATEVRLLQRMSTIPGFTNFRDVRILQGRPPPAFISAFKTWNTQQKSQKKDLSHFPDPSKKSSYTPTQLWAVIEMQDAGHDLERMVETGACTSIYTTWDIFWQTVLAIAKGEEGAEFEHRDLHLGNICVRFSPSTSSDTEIDTSRKLNFNGPGSLETTIIDYTISRCLMNDNSIAFTDLSLPSQTGVFEADATEEYQYEIYRYMRGALFFDDPYDNNSTSSSDRSWQQFHPQTNLVWLHLVLYKLLEQISWPSSSGKAPPKKKRKEYTLWKKSKDLEHILLQVQDLLDPGAILGNGIRSASDLVGFAVGEGWLDLEDVIGNGVDESALVSQLEALELK